MIRNGLFVHQLAVSRRGSDWHILWVSVIYHANLLYVCLLFVLHYRTPRRCVVLANIILQESHIFQLKFYKNFTQKIAPAPVNDTVHRDHGYPVYSNAVNGYFTEFV